MSISEWAGTAFNNRTPIVENENSRMAMDGTTILIISLGGKEVVTAKKPFFAKVNSNINQPVIKIIYLQTRLGVFDAFRYMEEEILPSPAPIPTRQINVNKSQTNSSIEYESIIFTYLFGYK